MFWYCIIINSKEIFLYIYSQHIKNNLIVLNGFSVCNWEILNILYLHSYALLLPVKFDYRGQ